MASRVVGLIAAGRPGALLRLYPFFCGSTPVLIRRAMPYNLSLLAPFGLGGAIRNRYACHQQRLTSSIVRSSQPLVEVAPLVPTYARRPGSWSRPSRRSKPLSAGVEGPCVAGPEAPFAAVTPEISGSMPPTSCSSKFSIAAAIDFSRSSPGSVRPAGGGWVEQSGARGRPRDYGLDVLDELLLEFLRCGSRASRKNFSKFF